MATDVPVVVGGLIGFGAFFVLWGYLVRRWSWLLMAGILVNAALAVAALLWPRGYELDTRGLLGILLVPTVLALMFAGLGIALRSVIRPRD